MNRTLENNQRILLISRDQQLQASRALLLESAGYSVIDLGSDAAVMQFLRLAIQPTLDQVLMCHLVPEKSRVLLCNAIKTVYQGTPILMLYHEYDPTSAAVDGRVQNLHDPQALLDTLKVLVTTTRASQGSSN